MTRLRTWSCLLVVLAASLAAASPGGAAIEPPRCGTPIPDAAGSLPATGTGNFAHIPWYAIGCTLDDIAARSNGRMTVERHGQSALGRDIYLVTINALDTKTQRKDYSNGQKIRRQQPAAVAVRPADQRAAEARPPGLQDGAVPGRPGSRSSTCPRSPCSPGR